LREQGQWSGEVVRTRRDGTALILSSRWLLRKDSDGRGIGVIETSADLTEQRRADSERLASERRYRTIFHSAGFAAWESDWSGVRRVLLDVAHGVPDLRKWLVLHPDIVREAAHQARIQEANQAAATLFDVDSPTDLIGANVIGRHSPDIEPLFADIFARLVGGADVVEVETRCRTLRGRTIDLVLRVTLLQEGEPWSRALITAMDVTERNGARARLGRASADLAHAARISMLGQLAASIAHEVNQPLTAILTYAKSASRWLRRESPELSDALTCLQQIVGNGRRAADVISRTRALARKAQPRSVPFSISELVDESLSLIQREAQAATVSVVRVPSATMGPVLGDRVQIQQVIVNLLINGIQAMQGIEGRSRQLRVTCECSDHRMVTVAIQDQGTGIRCDPDRLFEPFLSTKEDGMGMGLSICLSIVEAHGGRIRAVSNPDYGATVSFTLPLASS
jgi:C4-dicarboxylate-specific signal transduction histidine kinase